MVLLKAGSVVDDPWTQVGEDAAIPPSGPIIVTLAQWREHAEALASHDGPLGIRLASSESPADIAADLPRLALVALEFPTFKDGRAYSSARLLRERHGFDGEVRAVGDVLLEQLHYMHRCGFDAYEIESETAARDWLVAEGDLSVWYQPTADGRKTAMQLRHR